MISLVHGSLHVKRRWFSSQEPCKEWENRQWPVGEDMRFYTRKISVEWTLEGPRQLQGMGPGTASDSIHCCLPDGCWVTQGLGFGTHGLSPLNFKRSLARQPQSGVVHDSGYNCLVAKEKWCCHNNSLQSVSSFLPEIVKITGRTHLEEIATLR